MVFVTLFLVGFTQSAHAGNRKVAQFQTLQLEDVVFKIKEQEKSADVFFRTHAAIYPVSKKNKNYDSILKALKQSKDQEATVKFTVTVDPVEILDAKLSE